MILMLRKLNLIFMEHKGKVVVIGGDLHQLEIMLMELQQLMKSQDKAGSGIYMDFYLESRLFSCN